MSDIVAIGCGIGEYMVLKPPFSGIRGVGGAGGDEAGASLL